MRTSEERRKVNKKVKRASSKDRNKGESVSRYHKGIKVSLRRARRSRRG